MGLHVHVQLEGFIDSDTLTAMQVLLQSCMPLDRRAAPHTRVAVSTTVCLWRLH